GQAGGVAQNLGADDVAVQLLQDEDESHKPEGLDGVGDEDQQGGGHRADEGTEEGDDVGEADDDRHQQGAGEAHNDADDIAQHADDGRVHNLANDEPAEGAVNIGDLLQNQVGPVGAEDAVEQQLALGRKPFAGGEKVHR